MEKLVWYKTLLPFMCCLCFLVLAELNTSQASWHSPYIAPELYSPGLKSRKTFICVSAWDHYVSLSLPGSPPNLQWIIVTRGTCSPLVCHARATCLLPRTRGGAPSKPQGLNRATSSIGENKDIRSYTLAAFSMDLIFCKGISIWENLMLQWTNGFPIPTPYQLWAIKKDYFSERKIKLGTWKRRMHRGGQKSCPL